MDRIVTYFYCKKCNKGVDTRIGKCDGCNRRFNGKNLSKPYTQEELEEKIQQRIAEMEQTSVPEQGVAEERMEDGEMRCPVCGRRYDITHSICPECSSPLLMDAVEVTEPPVQSEEGEVYGDILENPIWKLKVRRYRNYLPEESRKEILINRRVTAVGRVYLALNHFFTYNVKDDQNSIVNVSKFNAVFIEEDGKLYIQYDHLVHRGFENEATRQKAPIYINGRKLEDGQRIRLTDNDSVTMGNGANLNMNLCVELVVQNRQAAAMWNEGTMGRIENFMTEFGEKMDSSIELTKQTLEHSKDIKNRIRKLSNIQVENFANVKNYLRELQSFENSYKEEDTSKSSQDYVEIYLQRHPNPTRFLRYLNEDQRKYLSSAAFFDYMMKEEGKTDVDCSGVFIYLGKMLEDFLNVRLVAFMNRYCKRQWRNVKKEDENAHYNIGHFTKVIKWKANDNSEWCSNADKLYEDIAEGVNQIRGNDYTNAGRVKAAFLMLDEVREIRNAAAHSFLDDVSSDKVNRVNYKEYKAAKEKLIETTYLMDIADYHEALFR